MWMWQKNINHTQYTPGEKSTSCFYACISLLIAAGFIIELCESDFVFVHNIQQNAMQVIAVVVRIVATYCDWREKIAVQ